MHAALWSALTALSLWVAPVSLLWPNVSRMTHEFCECIIIICPYSISISTDRGIMCSGHGKLESNEHLNSFSGARGPQFDEWVNDWNEHASAKFVGKL